MDEYNNEYISREILIRLGYSNLKPGKQVTIKCPSEYHEDKNPSCSVSLEKGVLYCFSCGFKANLKNLYYQKFGRSIYRDLGIQTSLPLQKQEIYLPNFDKTPETDFILSGKLLDPDSTDASKEWIQKRGFDIKTLGLLKTKLIKGGKIAKRSEPLNKDYWMYFNDKMFFPIFEHGKLISFEARDLSTKEKWEQLLLKKNIDPTKLVYKKVLYPKFSSVNTLFELDTLKKDQKLYLVEGLMDVVSLRTHPLFQNSTCTFGANITERQYYLLSQFNEICVIPNNDNAGLNALKSFKERNIIKNLTVLTLPPAVKDVNDILQKKDQRFNNLNDLVDHNWLQTKEKQLYNFSIDNYYRSLKKNE
jgi:DNA primase